MAFSNYDDPKIKELKKDIKQLEEEYEMLCQQARNSLGSLEQNRLDGQAESIYKKLETKKEQFRQKIKEIELKQYFSLLAELPKSKTIPLSRKELSAQNPVLIFDLLLQIDFKTQIQIVEKVINEYQIIGFLIHGEDYCGQQILVNRLYRIKSTWRNNKLISIDLSSYGVGRNLKSLWGRIAKYFGLSKDAEHYLIIEKICNSLKTQDIIFIFSKVEYMLFEPKTLDTWLKEFWQPLVKMAKEIKFPQKNHLLMFLVDNCGQVCQSDLLLTQEFNPNTYDPKLILSLPTSEEFSLTVLQEWFSLAISFSQFTMPADLTPLILYEESDNGKPQNVIEIICAYCDVSWEGELAKWLI